MEAYDGSDINHYIVHDRGTCIIDDEEIPLAFVVETLHDEEDDCWYFSAGVVPDIPLNEEENLVIDRVTYHGFIPCNINSINKHEIEFETYCYGWKVPDEDYDKALKMCESRASPILSLIGFYLDRPYNRLGQTGWDILKEWLGKSTLKEWLDFHT